MSAVASAPQAGAKAVGSGVAARAGHLPFLVALAIVAAPNLIFLATHLASPILAAGLLVCAAMALVMLARDSVRTRQALDLRLFGTCLAASFALSLLGGQAHVFYANDDWLIRDAVLRDLVAEPWPVGYAYRGDATMLRAPLGLYLMPASVGKAFGLGAAHFALLAQSAVLFGCILHMIASAFGARRRALWALALFIAFSGWDIVGTLRFHPWPPFGDHLEWWLGTLQYSSHVTQLFWVPNHAASGWMFVAAYLAWHDRRITAASLAVVFGFCVFWSPLSAIGSLPFLVRAIWTDFRCGRVGWGGVLQAGLAGVALLPVALYLAQDSTRIAHGGQDVSLAFLSAYVLFLAIEVGPAVAALRYLRPAAPVSILKGDTLLIVAVLLIVPLYRIGGADFVMRASIPALALLAIRVIEHLVPPEGAREPKRILWALAVFGIGAVTPVHEIGRTLMARPFAISDCNMMTASHFPPNDGPMFHYVARLDAMSASGSDRILKRPDRILEADPAAVCWPDRAPD